jgi:glyoxylase-like metal-dependent hydrolase (beta-lactamase superfamily II)
MMKAGLHEDVHYLRTESRLLGIPLAFYVYAVEGLLVDTGPASQRQVIIPFLKRSAIRQVALTHAHEDHCGLAAWIQQNLRVPIYLNEAQHGEVASDARLPLYRRLAWGPRKAFRPLPLPPVIETPNHRFEILPAPGHTPDHVVFWEREKGWLFTGDFFLGVSQVVAFQDEVSGRSIDSLKRLIGLGADTLFTAHSGILSEGRRHLNRRLEFLEELRAKVHELRAEGLSDRAIARRLLPRRKLITLISLGEWSTRHLVRGL